MQPQQNIGKFVQDQNDEKNDKEQNDDSRSIIQKSLQCQFNQNKLQAEQKSKKTSTNLKEWIFYNKYSQFFQGIIQQNSKDILEDTQSINSFKENLYKKLSTNNFFIVKSNFKNQNFLFYDIKSKVIQITKHFDVSNILCQLGPFAKKYFVLNQLQQSPRHHNSVIGLGTYGKIYHCQHYHDQHSKSVIKCLLYEDNQIEIIRNHIKEFFIYDLMSALEIGPKIIRKKGFDFTIFKNCLEFEIENCQLLVFQTLEKDIKFSLFAMHLLQIVHCDIKPTNIMFSPQHNRNVLLDFGTAQFIGVNWGTKIFTKFRGTYQFSGEQIRKYYFSDKPQKVDLYQNDVEMLSKTIQFANRQKKQSILSKKYQTKQNNYFLQILQKFFIHRQKNQIIYIYEQGWYIHPSIRPTDGRAIFFDFWMDGRTDERPSFATLIYEQQ